MAMPKMAPTSMNTGFEWGTSYSINEAYAPPLKYEYKMVPKASPVSWSLDPSDGFTLPSFEVEMIKVPVGTPYVDRGHHRVRHPGVGCTMEMVSALAGERWTDHPYTAHPRLARLMINTNDILPHDARQKMLEFVPRLLGTRNVFLDVELESMINQFGNEAYRIWSNARETGLEPNPVEAERMLRNTRRLLDEFDRSLGRPARKMDDQVLNQLMLALAA